MIASRARRIVGRIRRVARPWSRVTWSHYLDEFHAERPGITEEVLGDARADGISPYRWLIDALPTAGVVLDLACGSAPTLVDRARWVGADRSAAELRQAARRGAAPLVRADAAALPFATASFDAVSCSMAIMLLQPLDDVLAEIHRVLSRGGTAVLVLPGSRPLLTRDVLRYGRLMLAVRRGHLVYPNDRPLARLSQLASSAGFDLVDDRRVRFGYPMANQAATLRFVDSLYLPSVTKRRVAGAARVAARWAGSEIGIPLRRVVLRSR